MNTSFLGQIRIAGVLRRRKCANIPVNLIRSDLSHVASVSKFCHAKQTSRFVGRLRAPEILQVGRSGYGTQISDCIVLPVAIDVVGIVLRKSSMHIEPCQTMGEIAPVVNADLQVSVFSDASSNLSGNDVSRFDSANKDASLWIVGKKLVQSRLSDHVAPYQCGKLSKVAAGGDKSLVPRRVSCKTILRQRSP